MLVIAIDPHLAKFARIIASDINPSIGLDKLQVVFLPNRPFVSKGYEKLCQLLMPYANDHIVIVGHAGYPVRLMGQACKRLHKTFPTLTAAWINGYANGWVTLTTTRNITMRLQFPIVSRMLMLDPKNIWAPPLPAVEEEVI